MDIIEGGWNQTSTSLSIGAIAVSEKAKALELAVKEENIGFAFS